MPTGPKYPNQQLRSVSLETYFPGRLSVYGVLGEIQASVERTLPNLFVPNLQPGEPAALRPFQMRDAAQQRSLAVAVNQVTFVTFKYPGHESFIDEALPIVSAALDRIRPPTLNKVVYRYENEVGIARDEAKGLAVDVTFPGVVPGVFGGKQSRAINAAYEHGWNANGLQGAHGFHARTEDEGGVMVFKVTVFGSVEGCEISHLATATKEAHRVGLELFEALISPGFRDFISSTKGE
ncbi:MAG: hypothetical protein AMXMBFR56_37200 [Polyangiaceae bacterium]